MFNPRTSVLSVVKVLAFFGQSYIAPLLCKTLADLKLVADFRSLGMAAKHLADAALHLPIAGLLLRVDRPDAMVDDGRWSGCVHKRHPLGSELSAVAGSQLRRQRTRELGQLRRSEQLDSGKPILLTNGL